jgi:hypothetical protein
LARRKPLLQHLAIERLEGEVDARLVGRELVAGDAHVEVVEHHSAEDVRGGMIAHEQVPARPVHAALHRVALREAAVREAVHDARLLVDGLHDREGTRRAGERPSVAQHAAAGGEERGAVEDDPVVAHADDTGVERMEVAIALVETLGHGRERDVARVSPRSRAMTSRP